MRAAAVTAAAVTSWQVSARLRGIVLVGVEFVTRGGGILIMPRISIPGKEPAALLMQLGWTPPEQPPPRIRSTHLPDQS